MREPDDETLIDLYLQAERVASRILGPVLAEDIAETCIVRALTRWAQVRTSPKAWIARVATNLAIDEIRKRGRRFPTTEPVELSFENSATDRIVLAEALKDLPRRQREVVVLHHLVGLGDREVAEALHLSLPTVKTHLQRAMRALRQNSKLGRETLDANCKTI